MSDNQSGLSEADLADVIKDTASAKGLPNYAYISDKFFEYEREQIFSKTWTCIGNACSAHTPGDLWPVNFMGTPMVMVRNQHGQLRVFHNVCSHRGNELVWKACNSGPVIRCPYHAWAYSLDGALQATPHIGGQGVHEIDSVDKSTRGLREIRSMEWMGLVFVNLSGDAPPFEEHIAPLQQRIDGFASREQFAALKPASSHGSMTIDFAGNWKLCVENNLEAYHLPWVHPDLNAVSKLEDHYHYFGGVLFAGQGTRHYDHTRVNARELPVFKDWPGNTAEYPTIFPNVFLGLQCDHYWTRVVEPVAPQRTLDHLVIYYLGDAADSSEFEEARATRLEVWAKVFKEDIGVVEGMQRGRHSPAFAGGVFSPVMDEPSHYFARWIATALSN